MRLARADRDVEGGLQPKERLKVAPRVLLIIVLEADQHDVAQAPRSVHLGHAAREARNDVLAACAAAVKVHLAAMPPL